ncbi:YhcH/YjgK/YiaL family protein [Ilyobacter polytropus]|uniref:YhcH/YjgK/YiaL family protein n=1 Tax=Ilyobacter polytropus TaxID=167642 RepID=UPI0002E13B7C|nr:YhcH/YjgK/YiaL family protein [Ilyobacter polytropus]
MDTDLANIEAGVYEIQGRHMYAQIMDIETAFREYKKPEVHRIWVSILPFFPELLKELYDLFNVLSF